MPVPKGLKSRKWLNLDILSAGFAVVFVYKHVHCGAHGANPVQICTPGPARRDRCSAIAAPNRNNLEQ